jgi:hypothetical protein
VKLENEEMAQVIFFEFRKSRKDIISKKEFVERLLERQDLIMLFDFLDRGG